MILSVSTTCCRLPSGSAATLLTSLKSICQHVMGAGRSCGSCTGFSRVWMRSLADAGYDKSFCRKGQASGRTAARNCAADNTERPLDREPAASLPGDDLESRGFLLPPPD